MACLGKMDTYGYPMGTPKLRSAHSCTTLIALKISECFTQIMIQQMQTLHATNIHQRTVSHYNIYNIRMGFPQWVLNHSSQISSHKHNNMLVYLYYIYISNKTKETLYTFSDNFVWSCMLYIQYYYITKLKKHWGSFMSTYASQIDPNNMLNKIIQMH